MFFRNSKIILLLLALVSAPSYAGFPNDLDDVVFIEEGQHPGLTEFVRGMAVTGTLAVTIGGANPFGGQNVILDSSARNSWPAGPGGLSCCNANAWIVVKVGETWYAGTWEFLRIGQTTKSTLALVGANHLKFPPLNAFAPVSGEIYGYFNACITRNGITSRVNNCRERTTIALHQFGVGPVGLDAIDGAVEPEPEAAPVLSPVIDLLIGATAP
jgi:hypothetical protein